jgi:hypothetical protein
VQVAVKQTPATTLNGTGDLVDFINQNEANILQNQHIVPERFPADTLPFRGGSSITRQPWKANPLLTTKTINNPEARHMFAINTCNGCHITENFDNFFVHVKNRPIGISATLSPFLTGTIATDPVDLVTEREFNDLARRQQDMSDLLNMSCLAQITTTTISQPH